ARLPSLLGGDVNQGLAREAGVLVAEFVGLVEPRSVVPSEQVNGVFPYGHGGGGCDGTRHFASLPPFAHSVVHPGIVEEDNLAGLLAAGSHCIEALFGGRVLGADGMEPPRAARAVDSPWPDERSLAGPLQQVEHVRLGMGRG